MSLDKAIKYGKEHRKQYYDYAKLVDTTCRNHGSDDWSRDNRLYQSNKMKLKAKQHIEEYLKGTREDER